MRIGQIRALQAALRLRVAEGGRRAAVIADAEWLNPEAQNALLRLLEEPPPGTPLVLVARTAAGLLATRALALPARRASRRAGQRLARGRPDSVRELRTRLESSERRRCPALLDWAEEYRGARAEAPDAVEELLEIGAAWLRARVAAKLREPGADATAELDAFRRRSPPAASRWCSATRIPRWWPSARCSRCARRRAHEPGLLRHDADLLRQRRAAHRPRLHDRRRRHAARVITGCAASARFFVTGTDEHGEKIVEAAEQRGMTPQAVRRRNTRRPSARPGSSSGLRRRPLRPHHRSRPRAHGAGDPAAGSTTRARSSCASTRASTASAASASSPSATSWTASAAITSARPSCAARRTTSS